MKTKSACFANFWKRARARIGVKGNPPYRDCHFSGKSGVEPVISSIYASTCSQRWKKDLQG
ncbi:MAG: hypothetical protein SO072_09380 [Dysosmobacter sp.]|nr:hypothetical protein [Dysosmobacter sp.]